MCSLLLPLDRTPANIIYIVLPCPDVILYCRRQLYRASPVWEEPPEVRLMLEESTLSVTEEEVHRLPASINPHMNRIVVDLVQIILGKASVDIGTMFCGATS